MKRIFKLVPWSGGFSSFSGRRMALDDWTSMALLYSLCDRDGGFPCICMWDPGEKRR